MIIQPRASAEGSTVPIQTYSTVASSKLSLAALAPWFFVRDVALFIWNSLVFATRLVLVSLIILVQGVSGLKRQGVRQLMNRSYRLYSASFYTLLILVLLLVFVGWTVQTPWVTDVQASENNSLEVVATSPNDLFLEKGSLETLIPKSRPRIEVEYYRVQPGDTLSSIAEKFDISVDTIRWANNIGSANSVLKVGANLKIPPGSGVLVVVKKGDTLAALAKKYKSSDQLIADVNWLDPPYTLEAKSTLFIPNGVMPEQAPRARTTTTTASRRTTSLGGTAPLGKWVGWPVAGGRGGVSQCPNPYHVAVDIFDGSAPNLVAAADGEVIYAGWHHSGYANLVVIDHGNGYSTLYAHMSSIAVHVGQSVGKGQIIGRMGATGWATGIHVHFELRKGYGLQGHTINPVYSMQRRICY